MINDESLWRTVWKIRNDKYSFLFGNKFEKISGNLWMENIDNLEPFETNQIEANYSI